MSLRFHEIAEANHRILNPFTDEKLMQLGKICSLDKTHRQLDLACGKGEMLCRWSSAFGISGVGVDISEVFLTAAHMRAKELGVQSASTSFTATATSARCPSFDLVSCIGATWIGGGLAGTIELMKPALKDSGGLILIGEPFWNEPPPPTRCTKHSAWSRAISPPSQVRWTASTNLASNWWRWCSPTPTAGTDTKLRIG